MAQFESSRIWTETLGKSDAGNDPSNELVESLRHEFKSFRNRVTKLVELIPQDLKTLTIHDMSHIDALWEVASTLCGPEVISNPLEGFVLGGAFLLHDAGLALSSYSLGVSDLEKTPEWQVAMARLDDDAPERREQNAIDQTLRLRHANHAAQLGMIGYKFDGGDEQFLIENSQIREAFGEIIGLIAQSHWWSAEELEADESLRTLASPALPNCPALWEIDSKKLAYILRISDACQIDARRAPSLVRALRSPGGASTAHWSAQQHMCQPTVRNGAVVFTSTKSFESNQRNGWWTAYDLARIADAELRFAEDYTDEKAFEFRANRVKDISSPTRFAKHVTVSGWHPVETTPRITNPIGLIQKLGGAQLYGNDLTVPIRELLQNAHDAVVARRVIESRDEDWGCITISREKEDTEEILVVEDTGIGMSQEQILDYLLNFGESYWKSNLAAQEFPSLVVNQFSPQGQFGIGFFSVFMIASKVKITTRRYSDAQSETHVLEFFDQVNERPVLRKANKEEVVRDGGTCIRLWLRPGLKNVFKPIVGSPAQNISRREYLREEWTLNDLVQWLCPTSEVDIKVKIENEVNTAISANDWQTISASDLLCRILIYRTDYESLEKSRYVQYCIKAMHPICDSNDKMIGRACMVDRMSKTSVGPGLEGLITCGPFRSRSEAFCEGILIGRPKSSARFEAEALCRLSIDNGLREWGTMQAKVFADSPLFSLLSKCNVSSLLRSVCADIDPLPLVFHCGKFKTLPQLIKDAKSLVEIRLFERDDIPLREFMPQMFNSSTQMDQESPNDVGVLLGHMNGGQLVYPDGDPLKRSKDPYWTKVWFIPWGATIEAIAHAWECTIDDLLANAERNRSPVPNLEVPRTILRRPR